MSFADRIKFAMSIRNIKQAELVDKTKINKGALSSYISGRYVPKQKNVYLLAKALEVSPVWLMGYDVPMDETDSDINAFYSGLYQKIDLKNPGTLNSLKKYIRFDEHGTPYLHLPDLIDGINFEEDEKKSLLMKRYSQLNEIGKKRLIEYANDLVAGGRFNATNITATENETQNQTNDTIILAAKGGGLTKKELTPEQVDKLKKW